MIADPFLHKYVCMVCIHVRGVPMQMPLSNVIERYSEGISWQKETHAEGREQERRATNRNLVLVKVMRKAEVAKLI
jgi:hypothetical protein